MNKLTQALRVVENNENETEMESELAAAMSEQMAQDNPPAVTNPKEALTRARATQIASERTSSPETLRDRLVANTRGIIEQIERTKSEKLDAVRARVEVELEARRNQITECQKRVADAMEIARRNEAQIAAIQTEIGKIEAKGNATLADMTKLYDTLAASQYQALDVINDINKSKTLFER